MNQPAGRVWLKAESEPLRLVAAQSWAHSPLGRSGVHDVMDALDDPFPVNRMFTSWAVERILGRPLSTSEYEPTASPAVRAKQIATLKAATPSVPQSGS